MTDAKKFSAPLPLRAIYDQRLAGLDLRVLAAIAAHDRMSLATGKGQGCWTSHEKLSTKVNCNYINLGKSIKKLGVLGYVVRGKPTFGENKGRHIYRIPAHLYSHEESLSFHQLSKQSPEPAGNEPERGAPDALVHSVPQLVGQTANEGAELVCHGVEDYPFVSDTSPEQYISLSDVRYSAEAEKGYSSEEARLKSRLLPGEGEDGSASASLAIFQREIKKPGNGRLGDLLQWVRWLDHVGWEQAGTPEGYQAQRLVDEGLARLPEDELALYFAGEGDPAPEEPPPKEDVDAVRRQVASYCNGMNKAGKDALAGRCGLTARDLIAFLEGRLSLPIGKQMALRSAAKEAA